MPKLPAGPNPHHLFHEIDGKGDWDFGGGDAARTDDSATLRIRALAESQHGLVARRQLLSDGLGKGLIQERVRSGLLAPVERGVYAVGHRRPDRRHRWMAAVLACGGNAVLSHASAAHLWDLRGSRGWVHVSRPTRGRPRRGIQLHLAELSRGERATKDGIPVTTLERTLIDLAAGLDERQLGRAVAAAERSGRLSWGELRRIAREGDGRAGIVRLRNVLAAADPEAVEARSGTEVDFLTLCGKAGLPTPSVNVLIGESLVDFLWPEVQVIVEIDSYRYHGDRLAFERDHGSTLALEAAGYRVLRVTERMLAVDPEPFLALVHATLSGNRHQAGVPQVTFSMK